LFTALGDGRLVFRADDGSSGLALWVTDGSTAGTTLLKDIHPGPGATFLDELAALGDGRVVFAADDGSSGIELWVTDGTTAGTTLLKDINPGPGSSSPRGFAALGDTLTAV
jgi:ELWxxDGT repeat protein